MKVDFYRVETPPGTVFETLLGTIRSTSDDEKRAKNVRDTTVRMQEIHCSQQGVWTGDVRRLRMDEVPVKGSLAGRTVEVVLAPDEGIGEDTAFLYHPATQTLAIQRNRHAVSASLLLAYCDMFGSFNGAIIATTHLSGDAWKILYRTKELRSYEIRLARVNPQIVVSKGDSVETAIELIGQGEAPVFEFKVSMGYDRGSLGKDAIALVRKAISDAKGLFGFDAEVEKAHVSVKLEDDQTFAGDLMNYRMIEDIAIKSEANRILAYSTRAAAVKKAFDMRHDELVELTDGT